MDSDSFLEIRNNAAAGAIVFLHGFTGHLEHTWGNFYRFVLEDKLFDSWDLFSLGYSSSYLPDKKGWSSDPSIGLITKYVQAQITHGPLSQYKALTIVAHSMGGLVAQNVCASSYEAADKVANVIHFGTPSRGLKKAKVFGFYKKQIRDMKWDGPFVLQLRDNWDRIQTSSYAPNFTTVVGMNDDFVPEDSSLGPFSEKHHFVIPGNHLDIVNPESGDSYPIEALKAHLFGKDFKISPSLSAAQAVERREFKKAVEIYSSCCDSLDDEAFTLYALALDSLGDFEKAINVLERNLDRGTDVHGILAGRYKRRWRKFRSKFDADRACDLYAGAYEEARSKDDFGQCYYHAINMAFMALGYWKDDTKVNAWADRALKYAAKEPEDKWAKVTYAEALVYLGDVPQAINCYSEVLSSGKYTPREVSSILWQLSTLNEFLADDKIGQGLELLIG